MTIKSRGGLFADDEELGKKDDDRKSAKMGSWSVRTTNPIWRKRRIAGYILAVIVVYIFIRNIPTDMGPVAARIRPPRPDYRTPAQRANRAIPKSDYNWDKETYPYGVDEEVPPAAKAAPVAPAVPAQNAAEGTDGASTATDWTYDGPVRFYYLAASLHAIAGITDYRPGNRHVLFAASDLSSAATLVPIACEMAGWRRNTVHFAIMGREKLSMDEIMKINGAEWPVCPIYWHDARPDHNEDSTPARMQLSVSGAMGHINSFMHPQAVITTDSDHENVFFMVGLARSVKSLALTHIEIPKAKPEKLSWLARLDAGSLNAWHSSGVDILVQAPLESSGSLIRLLNSLQHADYSGFTPPRLTIELPHKIDQATQNFLAFFKWPPWQYQKNPTQADELIARRRISEQHINADEASLRFVESFYPSSPKGPHVLLLSPQAELSPGFFHYLKLHLLEFRHSLDRTEQYRNLFGISLETPTMHLNGSARFVPPVAATDDEDDGTYNPFRWQAPDSNAALYFSDKWIEFHSFLTKRRTASLHSRTEAHHASRSKLVSEKQPAWVEYALDLMRTRGYSLHYPGLFAHEKGHADTGGAGQSLVIIHNELYQPPEEFTRPLSNLHKRAEVDDAPSSESVLTVASDYLPSHHPLDDQSQEINEELPLVKALLPMLPTLEFVQTKDANGRVDVQPSRLPLPDLAKSPLLDYLGEQLADVGLQRRAADIRIGYRHLAGGCSVDAANIDNIQPGSAEDLFCLDDDEESPTKRVTPQEVDAARMSIAGAAHTQPRKHEEILPGSGAVADGAVKVIDTAKNVAAGVAGAAAAAVGADVDQSRAAQPVLDASNREAAHIDIPVHRPAKLSFEEEMAVRDARKKDSLADSARNQGGKLAAAVGKMRAATEADAEIEEGQNTITRPRSGKIGKIRVADENEDEQVPPRPPQPPPVAEDVTGDVEMDARDVDPPTKTAVGPGDLNAPVPRLRGTGVAAHVNAVDEPAKYAETARAGFLKKMAERPDSVAQAAAQQPKMGSAVHRQQAAKAEEVDGEEAPPTKTHVGPGDMDAPVPRLRATGAAAHVNAVEDSARYAETARAGFLKKMGKGE